MSHPPQEGSNRSLPLWTLLAVLRQMCNVWITAWNVTGSVLVTGKPSYPKQKSTIFHVFRGVYSCSTMPGTPSGHLVGLSSQNQTMLHMVLSVTCNWVVHDGRRTAQWTKCTHNAQTCTFNVQIIKYHK